MYSKLCFSFLLPLSLFAQEEIYLKTPDLSPANFLGMNVGIRPIRKSGVRIESEKIQEKLIIHNYGYGGSGLTLSLGGAQEVLRLLAKEAPQSKTVAVLGAGVIGMTTAYELLKAGYNVHLYSRNWTPFLTSNVAAGIWTPPSIKPHYSETTKELLVRILKNSEERFLQSLSDTPEFAGVRMGDSYSCLIGTEEILEGKDQGVDVIVHFDNGVVKKCKKTRQLSLDGALFMEDLYNKIQDRGAQLFDQDFQTLEDVLHLSEETIINCLSTGSVAVFGDDDFEPTRGQILYFKPQEEIDYLFYQNVPPDDYTWVSIFPWSDRLIVGGVKEKGETDLMIDWEIIQMIWDNAYKAISTIDEMGRHFGGTMVDEVHDGNR